MMAFPGPIQMLALMAILLLVFGPDKLPEMGKQFGKALRELMKAKQEFMSSINFDDDDNHKPYTPPSYNDESYYNNYTPSNYSGSDYSGSDYTTESSNPTAIEPPRTDFAAAAFADTDEFGTVPAPSNSVASPKSEATVTESETKTFSTPSGTFPRKK